MKERVGNVSGTTSRHRTTTAILVTPMPRMSLNAWLWPMLVPAYLDDSGPTLALTKSHCSLHSVTAASERPKLYKDARICDQGAELVALDLMFGHEHVQDNASTGGCNGKLLHGVAKGDQFLFDEMGVFLHFAPISVLHLADRPTGFSAAHPAPDPHWEFGRPHHFSTDFAGRCLCKSPKK